LTLLKQLLKECVSDMQTTNQIILKNKKIRFADYLVQCENAQMDALEHLDNIGSNWQVNRELRIRVGNDSKFQDYVGDLINFTIGAPDVSQFLKLKNSFNGLDMFSENIDPTCYHMEVHPLTSGKQSNKIQEKILENQKKCTKVFEKINEYVKGQAACAQITMVATRLHPLNNMALVCGLIPKEEKDFVHLLNIYNLCEEILNSYLAPQFHVILSYFQPRIFQAGEVQELYKMIKHSKVDFEITFDINKLSYQYFTNLNCYKTVIRL